MRQILVLHGQIVYVHGDDTAVAEAWTIYVLFSLELFPQDKETEKKKIENRIKYISDQNNRVLQTQQTPNPEAQLPSFFPPFDEHSSLEIQNNYISKLFITYTLESNHFCWISEPIQPLIVLTISNNLSQNFF